MARLAATKKRRIQIVCKHFLALHDAAMSTWTMFEMCSKIYPMAIFRVKLDKPVKDIIVDGFVKSAEIETP